MTHGQFDTDAAALKQRIKAHERFGSQDLNGWMFSKLELRPGLRFIELGCGIGKQTLPIAAAVGERGHVTAIDASEEALQSLAATAKQQGVQSRISTLRMSLDDLGSVVQSPLADRVLASYSVYYSTEPQNLFRAIYDALTPGGIFFFCGPSRQNNDELKQFQCALTGETPTDTKAAIFMDDTGQRLAHERFSEMEVFNFENTLEFDSPESLFSYWSSYNLYRRELETEFRAAAERHFASHPTFTTTKRVIGVRAIK